MVLDALLDFVFVLEHIYAVCDSDKNQSSALEVKVFHQHNPIGSMFKIANRDKGVSITDHDRIMMLETLITPEFLQFFIRFWSKKKTKSVKIQ